METTRHFTASVYIVNGNATALHHHDLLDRWLPPGGHIDRDELPHQAAIREVTEETGLNPTLVHHTEPVVEPAGETLPQPRYQVLYDVNVTAEGVGHQHIDHIYFARVTDDEIDPAPGEAPTHRWEWYTPADLQDTDLDPDVERLAQEAITAVDEI